jgi:hypothetical protein
MKKTVKHIVIAALLLIFTIPAAAKDGAYGSAGLKLIVSDDENISQQYTKSSAIMGWRNEMFDASASYNRWTSYSITDELLNSKEIDINQTGGDFTIYAGDMLSISGGYSYLNGTSSYIAHRAAGDIIFDFDGIDISLDSSIKDTEYEFNGMIKNTSIITGGEITFDITEKYFWDLSYIYEYTDYETYGYVYTKNSGRIGILAIPANNFFFLSGVSAGSDSDNINSAGFDAGLTIKIFKHLKLSAAYMLTAEFITSESETTTSGRRKSTATSSTSSSYTDISQTGNISVSLYF